MKTCVAILFLLMATLLHAETPQSETELDRLASQNPKIYLPQLLEAVDKRMQAAFDRRLATASPDLSKALKESQAKWLEFRDADSRVQIIEAGQGSGAVAFTLWRKIYQTRLRILQLETPFGQGWPKQADNRTTASSQPSSARAPEGGSR